MKGIKMGYTYRCAHTAEKDYLRFNENYRKKISALIKKMESNPRCREYEKLDGQKNWMSRRINVQHRMVYEINDDLHFFYFVYMYSHYKSAIEYRKIPDEVIEEIKNRG